MKQTTASTLPQRPAGHEEPLLRQEINLLSDVGMAVYQSGVRKRVSMGVGLVVLITTVVSLGVFYYGYIVNRQHQSLLSQKSVLEQQVALLEQQLTALALSQKRLVQIKKLLVEQDKQLSPGVMEREIVVLADHIEAVLVSLGWEQQTLTAKFSLADITKVNWLMEALKQREVEGLWTGVRIADLDRQQDGKYNLEFSADLAKVLPKNN